MEVKEINHLLTSIFNNVLIIEENKLKNSNFPDVTLKEMHTIDAVGEDEARTPSQVAKSLMLSTSTITISLNNLEKKGYIERTRSDSDRRVVYISLTEKGKLVYKSHKSFHERMIERFVHDLKEEEVAVMAKGLLNLSRFLEESKK
ncbi:MAG: MarR family transcriptional regulator [Streptococcaceae bacterium]|nr:MarR family transcriptional regulator [Streptococcaceae bacterium]